MATRMIQVQVHYVEGDVKAMFKFSPDMTVSQACQTVEEHFCEGEPDKEFGLVRPTGKDLLQGKWLEQECTLSESDLRTGDCLQFICRYRPLTVKTLDGAVLNLMVDESQTVKEVIGAACVEIGVKSSEEFAFVTEEDLSKRRRKSLLSSKKAKSLRRKRHSGDDGVKWLDPLKTLREQGVGEKEVLVLRKRFFFSEETVDGCDAAEMGLVYVQSRNGILSGTYPVSKEEAIQFAALQCHVELGVYSAKEHQPGCLKLASFVPNEYVKSKNIEKKILEEYKKLAHTSSDHDAKARYIQLCRSLKTFGVTFFAVKEKMKGRNKMVPRLIGITRENITKMDEKTKEVLAVWPLHTVRKWAYTSSSFTLDFGSYSDSFYSAQTMEGEAICQLISGYVDITVKKKRAREWRDSDQESVGSGAGSLEDSMEMPLDDVDGGCFAVEVTSTDLDSLLKKALLSCDAAASQLAPSQSRSSTRQPPTDSTEVSTISSAVVAILSSTANLLASSAVELNSGERVKMAASFKTMAMGLNSLVTATRSAAEDCLTDEDRQHLMDTAHKLSIAAVHVLSTVQEIQDKDKMQELQASARAVGTAGEYLLHVCEVPVLDLNTQKVISVSSQDIIRRTAYLGQIAVNLVETCSDGDGDNDTAVKRRVSEVVDNLLDKSSVLAVSASLLSPLLAHPSCQDGLTEAVKMVADAAEKTGVLTQPVCNSDSALSELAEAGSAVIDELQSLLAELSRCSLTSMCYHLEQNLSLLSGAADRIVQCTTGAGDMMREAKTIGKGFECLVDLLNLQSEREEDPSATRALLDASKKITRASLNVIEGAKKLSYDADADGQEALKAAATELQNVCTSVSMLLLMQQSAPRLEVAANNACTVTAQLVEAALEVSQDTSTGDSVQVELEGKSEAARRDLVALLKVLNDSHSGNPSGGGSLPVTTQAALSLVTSAGVLVSAVKSSVPVISDQAASLQLNSLAKSTNTVVAELRTAANKALRVTQMEDLGSCSEVLRNMLVQVVPSGQEVPGAGGVLQLSTAEYKARLSPAVHAVAAAKRKLLAALGGVSVGEMVAATKDYVQAVKEWCHVMCHVTEDNGTRARTQDALRKVLEHTNSIVLEVKATAATGGSYMAVARKLEEVSVCVRAAVDSIEGGDEPSQSSEDQPPVKKGWRQRVMDWVILPVYRLIVWLVCLPYVCTRCLLIRLYMAVCFTLGLFHSAACWLLQPVYRCGHWLLQPVYRCGHWLLQPVYRCGHWLLQPVYRCGHWLLQPVYHCARSFLLLVYRCLQWMAFACLLCICPCYRPSYLAIKHIRKWWKKRSLPRKTDLVNDSFSDVSSCGSSFDLSDDDDDDDDENGPTGMYSGVPDLIPNPREQAADKGKLKVE